MNTVSKYTVSHIHATRHKKTPQKKIVMHKNIDKPEKPQKLILSHSKPFQLYSSHCQNVIYPIDHILNTDYTLLEKNKNSRVFICIYRLKACRSTKQMQYIEYLLYKYPAKTKRSSLRNSFIFPFTISDGKETFVVVANQLFYEITNGRYGKSKSLGFLESGNDVYFFYQAIEKTPESTVEHYSSHSELWWTLIDEICNHKEIIDYPIHPTVIQLFYMNPTLIYLRDDKNQRMDIPSVGYIGAYYKLLPAVALSIDTVTNSERFFGSFLYAVRQGGWTDNFKSQSIDGMEIANKNGKYTQGGVIRFAVFLNSTDVVGVTNRDLEKYISNPDKWKINFQSIFYGKLKRKGKIHSDNPHFKVATFGQQVPLSLHWLDMKTLKEWNPKSTAYRIL